MITRTISMLLLTLLSVSPLKANELEKPPLFRPSDETIERTKLQQQKLMEQERVQLQEQQRQADLIRDHDPREHDHDHDDAEDLDHEHDDPLAHQKQLEEMKAQGIEEQRPWWKIW